MAQAGCPDREELSAYVLGKLPEELEQRLAGHAAQCTECQSRLHSLDTVADSLISHIRQPRPGTAAGDEPALQRLLSQAESIVMQPVKSSDRPAAGAAVVAVEQFVQSLSDSELLSAAEVQAFLSGLKAPQKADTRLLAQELVRQQRLTRYQALMLLQGKPKGLVLGNYVILDKLGQGGMGMVFKARHRRMKREVALKVLPPAITKNANAVQRFQREVEAAAKLSHPHIVAAHDADEAKGVHFLVMELVDGVDLSKLVKQLGPLTVGQAVSCILQAAKGLEHAHAAGITHRDIKPSNLLLSARSDRLQPVAASRPAEAGHYQQSVVKILDMGLARIEGAHAGAGSKELTETGSILGTCEYMAPEQAMNTRLADHRADIYSLGGTLFFLLTGKTMYSGETAIEMLFAQREQPIPSLRQARPDAPKKLEAIYQKMVAKEPKDRYQSMSELVAALEASRLADASGLAELIQDAQSKPAARTGSDTREEALEDLTEARVLRRAVPVSGPRRRWRLPLAAAAIAAGILLAFAVFRVETPQGTFVIETDDPDVAVMLDKLGGVVIHDKKTERRFTLKRGQHPLPTGEYEIEVADKSTGLTFSTRVFTIKRGEQAVVKARLEKAVASGDRKQPLGKGFDDSWIKSVAVLPPEKQVDAVLQKLKDLNPNFDGKARNRWIAGGVVTGLELDGKHIANIAPIQALPQLTQLMCGGSPDEPSPLTDLTPLQGLKLEALTISYTQVSDLSPLRGMKSLKRLYCDHAPLTNLAPLAGLKLEKFHCDGPIIADLSVLRDMPLESVGYRRPEQHRAVLSAIPTLKTINGKPKDEVLAAKVDAAFEQWIKDVQQLPPQKQVDAVLARLKQLNPNFDPLSAKVFIGETIVAGLVLDAKHLTDISPVRALRGLTVLHCCGRANDQAAFADLRPLEGMELETLNVSYTQVTDLSALRGMKTLKQLYCDGTRLGDLSPLAGLKLQRFYGFGRRFEDISVLKDMPLEAVWCSQPDAHRAVWSAIPTLKTINGKPKEEMLGMAKPDPIFEAWVTATRNLPPNEQVVAVVKKLQERNPGFDGTHHAKPSPKVGVDLLSITADQVTDLSPLRGFRRLGNLHCSGSVPLRGKLADLSPLQGVPGLTWLHLDFTLVADLQPLAGLPLTGLSLQGTRVNDLAPLKGMALTSLTIRGTSVGDISVVRGMPLEAIDLMGTKVTDLSPLQGSRLVSIWYDPRPGPNADILRAIPTLKRINAQPADEVLKKLPDAK